MNKTEYINLLQHEMQDLPSATQAELLEKTQKQFESELAAGKSEAEICEKLAHPRVVAAQARASMRFQTLKRDFSVGNLFGLCIALIGVMFFNLIMVVPAFAYSIFLFASYLGSLAVWLAGVGVLAASMSGVPEVQFKGPHHSHAQNHRGYDVKHFGARNIRVDVSERGIIVDKEGVRETVEMAASNRDSAMHFDHQPSTITIKNQMQGWHFFLGLALLVLGTGLLLLCLMLTRLTFIGFKKYLLWNLAILRAPLAA